MTIRDMTLSDRDTYRTMAIDFYGGEATLFPITDEKLDATLTETLSPSPRARLLLFEENGRPVGYGNLTFSFSTEAGGPVCWIEEIYVIPEARGRGLGHEFLQWVLTVYRADMKRFRLEVCPSNPDAKRLYAALGFKSLDYQQMYTEAQCASAHCRD